MSMTDLPIVIPVGPNLWFVASAATAKGAYWPVRRVLDHGRWTFACPCPWGHREGETKPPGQRTACRHMKAVVKFEDYRLRRPTAPPNVGALVD